MRIKLLFLMCSLILLVCKCIKCTIIPLMVLNEVAVFIINIIILIGGLSHLKYSAPVEIVPVSKLLFCTDRQLTRTAVPQHMRGDIKPILWKFVHLLWCVCKWGRVEEVYNRYKNKNMEDYGCHVLICCWWVIRSDRGWVIE